MITRCLNCGRILTDSTGRLHQVCFNSDLPHRPEERETTWARCLPCTNTAVGQLADMQNETKKK
jgi:hypothetical protein